MISRLQAESMANIQVASGLLIYSGTDPNVTCKLIAVCCSCQREYQRRMKDRLR